MNGNIVWENLLKCAKKSLFIIDTTGDAIEPLNCNLVAFKDKCMLHKKICVWYVTWYLCVGKNVIANPVHDTLPIFALTGK